MKTIFQPIFESIWKRKESKVFLLFSLFPLLYLVATFLPSQSNFMVMTTEKGHYTSFFPFWSIILHSTENFFLPSLALYFVAYSTFKKESTDHVFFLYKDIDRNSIFWAKIWSMIALVGIFLLSFTAVMLVVYYTRAIHLPGFSSKLWGDDIDNLSSLTEFCRVFLAFLLTIFMASAVSLYFNITMTMVIAIAFNMAMIIFGLVGGPLSYLSPNHFASMGIMDGQFLVAFAGIISLSLVYIGISNYFAKVKFKTLEF